MAAPKGAEAELEGIVVIGRPNRHGLQLPLTRRPGRKERVGLHACIDEGQFHLRGHRQRLGVNLAASDDHDPIMPLTSRKCLVQITGQHHAFRQLRPPSADDDIETAGQWPPDRFEGASPHHHRVPEGDRLEMLQVGGQVPGHGTSLADGAVTGHGGNQNDVAGHEKQQDPFIKCR